MRQESKKIRYDHVFEGSFKKVLIVQISSVARLVCTSSLVHDLKESSGAHVALLVRPHWVEVAQSIPGVDEVIPTGKDRADIGLFEAVSLGRALGRKNFDVLIAPDSTLHLALLAGLSGTKARIAYRSGIGRLFYNFKVNANMRQSCLQLRDQDLLRILRIDSSQNRLRMKAPKRMDEYLADFYSKNNLEPGEKMVAFCLDSPRPVMRWPAVYFSSLAQSLLARGFKPVLLGIGSNRKISLEIIKSVGQYLPSYFSDELSRLGSVLSKCSMTVGGDSGLVHMSRALGVPTVLIFGPSDPRRFHYEDHTRVLYSSVRCQPCSYRGNKQCPESHHDCMRLVSPERVMEALRQIADLQTPVPLAAQVGEGEIRKSESIPLR